MQCPATRNGNQEPGQKGIRTQRHATRDAESIVTNRNS
jgi:hypothetical protein